MLETQIEIWQAPVAKAKLRQMLQFAGSESSVFQFGVSSSISVTTRRDKASYIRMDAEMRAAW
jgi:hypothetical protein